MAVNKDLFGFDELEKAFNRTIKRYPNEADALLMAQGQAVTKSTKSKTPVKTGKLRRSWRLKKVKVYKSGTVRVVRIQSSAPHAHLIEYGHKVYTTGGRKGKVGRYNAVQRSVRGIKSHGNVQGVHMLEESVKEAQQRFDRDAQKMIDKTTEKDIETAIAGLLNKSGFNVTASELKEGFPKPTFFIDVFPSSSSLSGPLLEKVDISVELKYIPAIEKTEHLIDVINKLKYLFLYQPLTVNDRKLTVQTIEFERENYVLYAYFAVSFLQEIPVDDDYENIEEIKLGGIL